MHLQANASHEILRVCDQYLHVDTGTKLHVFEIRELRAIFRRVPLLIAFEFDRGADRDEREQQDGKNYMLSHGLSHFIDQSHGAAHSARLSAFTHAFKRWTGKTPRQMRAAGAY